MFRSFRAENLKRLDLSLYFRLKHAGSKRAYRFLDKRFYHRRRWDFDLREFACEHVGLSRNYDTGELKRKLRLIIEELEREGFLEPLSQNEQYMKVRRGEWRIILIQKVPVRSQKPRRASLQAIERELVARGVTAGVAADLVAAHSAERVGVKVDVFDWMAERKDKRLSKNPAGYLVKSIIDDYVPPKGYETKAQREAKDARQREQDKARRKRDADEQAQYERELAPIREYWSSLTTRQQAQLEQAAIAAASPFLAGQYRRTKNDSGPMAESIRKAIIDDHIRRLLNSTDAGR